MHIEMSIEQLRANPDYHDYLLHLADTTLILGQRLCEWCGHGPILEQDIAMSNIALDLLGEASNLYEYLAELKGAPHTADSLAMLRAEREYKNLLLVELPNGHFGDTVARQFFFEAYHCLLLEQLKSSKDERLAAIAEKSLLEAKYHLRWAAEWMIRLGDGTEESYQKISQAVDDIKPYLEEPFNPTDYEVRLIEGKHIPDSSTFKASWKKKVSETLAEATIDVDLAVAAPQKGGKTGLHTENMGYILAELQYLQRAYPGLNW